jgi:hypothetical protein
VTVSQLDATRTRIAKSRAMAVLQDCPGLRVEVYVDKAPLQEYSDDEQEQTPKSVTKYIESQSGKRFYIKYFFAPPFPLQHGVEVRIFIDGEVMQKSYIAVADLHRPKGYCLSGSCYLQDGEWYVQNYCFTALNIGKVCTKPLCTFAMLILYSGRRF